tara:strand:- start:390 stop:635 length:246 start_codon:yes stop_codon:yes gene_type:complete
MKNAGCAFMAEGAASGVAEATFGVAEATFGVASDFLQIFLAAETQRALRRSSQSGPLRQRLARPKKPKQSKKKAKKKPTKP